MSEKDVVYALQMLHVVQIKREAIEFASYINKQFSKLPKKEKERIWYKYLKE